jgi:DNA repair protein RadC
VSAADLPPAAALTLDQVPEEDHPRARLVRYGAGALSNRELLAVLCCDGRELAPDCPSLRELAGASYDELTTSGLPPARAARVLAALELGARAASAPREVAAAFRTPEETARWLLPRYSTRPIEMFGVLCLDVRHRLKREAVVSVGCLTASLVHPREVFSVAIAARAAALILFHNHPSGDPEPSAEDVALTRRLVAAGTLLGIEVLDHVVLGAGRFVSLKERGML